MVKFAHIYGHYSLGICWAGVIAFVLQEIPYMLMPLIGPDPNPIMEMQNEIPWIAAAQSVFGVASMVLLMLLVRDDVPFFSVSSAREKACFALTLGMILINFAGWAFYYAGHQTGWLIVLCQFAAVPLYYLCFGLWKKNVPLTGTATVFFVIHTVNGYLNFIAAK